MREEGGGRAQGWLLDCWLEYVGHTILELREEDRWQTSLEAGGALFWSVRFGTPKRSQGYAVSDHGRGHCQV